MSKIPASLFDCRRSLKLQFYAVLCVIFCAGPSFSGSSMMIPMDMTKIQIGSQITYIFPGGDNRTAVFNGKKGKHYQVTVFEGDLSSGLILSVETYTREGNLVRMDFVGGDKVVYQPHSCERNLGACKYSFRNGNRNRIFMKSVGRRTASGLVSEHFYNGANGRNSTFYKIDYVFGKHGVVTQGKHSITGFEYFLDDIMINGKFLRGGRFFIDGQYRRVRFTSKNNSIR